LDGTDFHSGNLIASGEHPILVDLEALFHPRRSSPEPGEPVAADRIARRTISNSVLSIDLLPERVWSNSEHEGVDISGLGTPEGQVTPHPLPLWEAAGTDVMHLVRRRKPIGTRNHRPKLAGAPVNVTDYRQAILDGFAATYSMLLTHRDEMLSDEGPLAPFHEDEVCVFLRSSRTYRRLLRESYHPDVLRDALDRERLFDMLWIEVERQPELLTVIRTEREDLLRGDIPVFTTRPGSRDLWTSGKEIVPDFFSEASLSAVQRRLRSLGEEDFARQAWFIQASLSTLCPDGMDRSTYPAPSRRAEPNCDRFARAAEAAGDRLKALALRGETDATWIGVDLARDRVWSVAPSGLDLYGGVPGIALFLAYLGRVTGNEHHRALAQAALVTIRSLIQKRESSLIRIGGFDGWGGLIYVLTHLGVLWDRAELIAEAESLVDLLPALIDRDDVLDVEGGAAGCILALCALQKPAPSGRLASVAVQCGDHLLARGEPMAAGIGWRPKFGGPRPLAGFLHGAAGSALALLRLYAWTGLERFRAAASGAWAYERGLFVEDAEHWPDLREHIRSATAGEGKRAGFTASWCHGAAGIGLARIRSLDVIDDPDVQAEIAVALETTLREGFGYDHSLCHGDLVNLELLFQASRILKESRWDAEFRRLAAMVLGSIETNGSRSGVPFGVETPGLMAGLAGIGYGMLRLAAPDCVPSVLTLEPPFQEWLRERR
jgi:type 2 lantibiotic biosynthesis protein LanM